MPNIITNNGVGHCSIVHWNEFDSLIKNELRTFEYIFRGHRKSSWNLLPVLYRKYPNLSPQDKTNHLNQFKKSTYGRIGDNPHRPDNDENYWWSLGQHYGLLTPLLDWTVSPFVALFFAFEKHNEHNEPRAVWATFAKWNLEYVHSQIRNHNRDYSTVVEYIEPLSDSNKRLSNQSGSFIKFNQNIPLEEWLRQNLPNEMTISIVLKIEIPDIDRLGCLAYLNRMNINHKTLYPDLIGSSKFTNTKLEIGQPYFT